MNREETKKILAIIVANFQRFEVSKPVVDLWAYSLSDREYRVCEVAVMRYIQTNKWPPTIADIRASIVDTTMPTGKTSGEAWGDVMRAIKHFGQYEVEAAMNSFDPITRSIVKRLGFVEICNSVKIGVDRGQFMKAYDAEYSKQHEIATMSTNLVKQIELLRGEPLGITGGNENGKIEERKKLCE